MQTKLQRQRSVDCLVRRYRLRCIAQLLKFGASEDLCDRVLQIWETGSQGEGTSDDRALQQVQKILAKSMPVKQPNQQRIAA